MKIFSTLKSIIIKEGITNFIKRKMNISFLDSKTLYTIHYRNNKTKIFLDPKFGFVDKMIFTKGVYEKDIVDDIVNSLDKEKVMLDIGANIGQHSLLSAPFCKEIYAFEPIPDVYNQFKKSIKTNNIKNLHLYNLAIGEKKESKSFNYITNHAGASSFVKTDEGNKKVITVNIDTLQNILGNKKFDVIKLDVEGYEAVVILGNKEIILKNRPVIFMEFAPESIKKEGKYSPIELLRFFIDHKYEIYSRELKTKIFDEDLQNVKNDNLILNPK